METNVYVCKKCKRELGDDKKLCHDCQNKKDDEEKTVVRLILGGLSIVGVVIIKRFVGSNNKL